MELNTFTMICCLAGACLIGLGASGFYYLAKNFHKFMNGGDDL
jgi:hypothetical protein